MLAAASRSVAGFVAVKQNPKKPSKLQKMQAATNWYLFAIGYMAAIKLTVALTIPSDDRLLAALWEQGVVRDPLRHPFFYPHPGR
jgi:hypothetical protein